MSRKSSSQRSLIFISLAVPTLALLTLALKPKAALGSDTVPIKGTFTVQAELITAISACGLGDANCNACLNGSGFYIEAQGVGDTSQGPLYFEVLKCFNPTSGFGTYAGTFTMTAPNGKDSVTGTYSGQNNNAGDAYGFGPFGGKLTITGGIGKFEGAQGSASFTAVAGPLTAGPSPGTNVLMAFYSVQGNLLQPNE
jgi:hypothetical protein